MVCSQHLPHCGISGRGSLDPTTLDLTRVDLTRVDLTRVDLTRVDLIVDRTHSIHEPIKNNSLPLFRCPTPKTKNNQAGQISMLKDDVALLVIIHIHSTQRGGPEHLL